MENQNENAINEIPTVVDGVVTPDVPAAATTADGPPKGYENQPPELWPDKDGNPPKLTDALVRRMRGKYFTVRHVLLNDCGHRLDMINEPRHRHCENCWFQFFNTHPQLIETADQFFRTQGKAAVIKLRGETFFKMFVRYMATIIEFMRQEGRLPNESSNPERPAEGAVSVGISSGLIAEQAV